MPQVSGRCEWILWGVQYQKTQFLTLLCKLRLYQFAVPGQELGLLYRNYSGIGGFWWRRRELNPGPGKVHRGVYRFRSGLNSRPRSLPLTRLSQASLPEVSPLCRQADTKTSPMVSLPPMAYQASATETLAIYAARA